MCMRPDQAYKIESNDDIEGYIIKFDTELITKIERHVNSLSLVALLELFSNTEGIQLTPEMAHILRELIDQLSFVLVNTEVQKNRTTELLYRTYSYPPLIKLERIFERIG